MRIGWGILGGGKVVESKSGPAFNIPNASYVAAVCRRSPSAAQYTAEKLGAANWYSSYEAMLQDEAVDAVYIATPPGLHYEQAILCLEARKPVYIEKPFTTSLAQAQCLVDKFAAAGLPLFVAHYRRAMEKFLALKNVVDQDLGDVVDFSFRLNRRLEDDKMHPWMYQREMSGGGKFFDISAHSLDLFLFYFGAVERMTSEAQHWQAPNGTEDCVTLNFRFESGILGTATYNFLSREKSDRLRVYGTGGDLAMSVHGDAPSVLRKRNGRTRELSHRLPPFIEAPMIKEVVSSLRGQNGTPCTGQDALAVMALMEAGLGSLRPPPSI